MGFQNNEDNLRFVLGAYDLFGPGILFLPVVEVVENFEGNILFGCVHLNLLIYISPVAYDNKW